jgi:hypothetical protein
LVTEQIIAQVADCDVDAAARPRRRARDGALRVAGTLDLEQAQSNRGPGGRVKDTRMQARARVLLFRY